MKSHKSIPLESPPILSFQKNLNVVPRGARASGSAGLGVECSVWPQSCVDASGPEEKGRAGECSFPWEPHSSTHPRIPAREQALCKSLFAGPALTRNSASCLRPSALMSSPVGREKDLKSLSRTSFPPHSPPCPAHPYPHSRGNQAHALPGRSEAQTHTSPLPLPSDYKWRLVGTEECRQQAPLTRLLPTSL